ncbi:putative Serine/threonine-protein kinase Nek9 [Diplocarpon rosae]|nr:putative Serine/threonine-protein kinase Nek9 [Diplocarpon rosae]
MELWASGFNAWGQLDFSGEGGIGAQDLKHFMRILEDESIRILRTSVSAILVSTQRGTRIAGSPDEFIQHCQKRSDNFSNAAIAGNEKIVAFIPGGPNRHCLAEYKNFEEPPIILGEFEEMHDIVANQTTFTALAKSGHIYTWGDGRYPNCLGRDLDENPADVPGIVEDLLELTGRGIVKISSAGYVTAALTEDNDVYVWGGRAGQKPILEGLGGTPIPLDLDGEEFFDVAVGMDHMLVVTTGHKLFVVGSGGSKQLGVDVEEAESWMEVKLPLQEGKRIVGVHAGYKSSFVLVDGMP